MDPSFHWNGAWDGWDNTLLNACDDKDNWGLVDNAGHVIIPLRYENRSSQSFLSTNNAWHRPAATIKKKGFMSVIDTLGNTLVPFEYNYISLNDLAYLDKGFTHVRKIGRDNIVDAAGHKLLPDKYTEIIPKPDDRHGFIVRADSKLGYISYPDLKLVLPPNYETLSSSDSLIIASLNGKYGLYGKDFKELLPFVYSYMAFKDGVIMVQRNDTTIPVIEAEQQQGNHTLTKDKKVYTRTLDIHTLAPKTDWTENDPFANMFPVQDWCGYGHHLAREIQDFEEQIPKVNVNGSMVREFQKDSIAWTTQPSFRWMDADVIVKGNLISNPSKHYAAIIDRSLNYIVKPLPAPILPVACNPKDSFITVFENNKFGVIDTRGNEIIPLQQKQISFAFRWKNKIYAAVFDHNNARNGLDAIAGYDSYPYMRVGDNHLRIINADGQYVPALDSFDISMMTTKSGQRTSTCNTSCFLVTNHEGNVGLMAPDGTVLYPNISFKHKTLRGLGDGLFMVPERDNYYTQGQVYDQNDKQLFPELGPLIVEDADINRYRSYHEKGATEQDHIYHIYRVYYYISNIQQGMFYMDAKGKAFAQKIKK